MGVVIVEVIRYAVVTHACTDSPCRSSAIVRIAVLTIVWSRAPRNIPSIRPDRIVSTWAWVYSPVSAEVALALIGSSLGRGAQSPASSQDGPVDSVPFLHDTGRGSRRP